MAKLTIDGSSQDVADGEKIKDAAETLGIPFGCEDGNCGVCKCEVLSGAENLTEKTDKEPAFCEADNERLACQCKIKQGEVVMQSKI